MKMNKNVVNLVFHTLFDETKFENVSFLEDDQVIYIKIKICFYLLLNPIGIE